MRRTCSIAAIRARTAEGNARRGMALLDPSAWYLQLELDRQQLAPGLLVSPLGPSDRSLIRQLFDRADERLAALVEGDR